MERYLLALSLLLITQCKAREQPAVRTGKQGASNQVYPGDTGATPPPVEETTENSVIFDTNKPHEVPIKFAITNKGGMEETITLKRSLTTQSKSYTQVNQAQHDDFSTKAGVTDYALDYYVNPNLPFSVKVENVLLARLKYTFPAPNILRFNITLAAGSDVDMYYFAANKALKTQWDIGEKATKIQASVNGASAGGSYDALSGMLTISPTPPSAAKIVIKWVNDNGIGMKYPSKGPAGSVAKGIFKEQEIEVQHNGSEVEFNLTQDEVAAGDTVKVTYTKAPGAVTTFPLNGLEEGSLKVIEAPSQCQDGTNFVASGGTLSFTCDATQEKEIVKLQYRSTEYKVVLVDKFTNPDGGDWTVFVDNIAVTNYKRRRGVFTFDSDIGPGHTLKFIYAAGTPPRDGTTPDDPPPTPGTTTTNDGTGPVIIQ